MWKKRQAQLNRAMEEPKKQANARPSKMPSTVPLAKQVGAVSEYQVIEQNQKQCAAWASARTFMCADCILFEILTTYKQCECQGSAVKHIMVTMTAIGQILCRHMPA